MLLRFVFSVWIWAVLIAAAALSCVAMLPVVVLSFGRDPQRVLAGRIFRRMARLVGQLSPLWRFGATQPFPTALDEPFVVISNHQSHLDSFLISSLPWEMKWLAKRSLFAIPFIGWAMALAGDVAVVRTRGQSIGRAMQRCRALLDSGVSVFIFPEGTRNRTDGGIQPFKNGAFRLALEAGVRILPLGLWGTRPALPRGAFLFNWSKARVAVGEPIASRPLLERCSDGKEINWPMAIEALKSASEAAVKQQVERARLSI